MKKFLTLLLFFSILSPSISQERWISGIITDGYAPLENVQVQVVNQALVSVSDEDGRYSINASPGDKLFYASDGMEPLQIRVEDVTRTLNIDMFPKVEKLDNVTVTGKRNRSQKELELAYFDNPNIIKTAFGYLDKTRASYSVRMLNSNQILPGEYDLANVLRGRFAGVSVRAGLGFSRGISFSNTSADVGFQGLTGVGGQRAVFIRSGRAIFDIDGQIFTDFPDFIDVQNIERIAVIASAAGATKYGFLGRGGVIVINTKTGTALPKDKNGLVLDRMRLRDNYLQEKVLTSHEVDRNAPTYLKELQSSNSFTSAKESFEANAKKYSSSYSFVLDSYQFFHDVLNEVDYADDIIEKAFFTFGNNPIYLKALSYIYEEQGRHEKANEALKDVFILRPNYAQSYRDLANSSRNLRDSRRSAELHTRYLHLLDEGFMQADTSTFTTLMNREFDNLLTLEKTDVMGQSRSRKVKVKEPNFEGTRLVFEWNDSEAEFELQFVNPDNQFYTWKHTLRDNPEVIQKEKDFGYSCSEYLIDQSLSGTWKINMNYLGNKSLTPTYLKASIYYNYGSKSQRKEVKVFKLGIKDVNQELFRVQSVAANVSR
nr:hypothetical protein [Allomuricauda sp.]